MTEEKWRPIPGHAGYEVSDQGRVRSFKIAGSPTGISSVPCVLRTSVDRRGRHSVTLRNAPFRKRQMRVHVAVLLAFVGPRPRGLEGCHKDDDRDNNRLDNLRWGTRRENSLDSLNNGTRCMGSAHPLAKLTENDVIAIREAGAGGATPVLLAAEFCVSRITIHRILAGTRWKHVGSDVCRIFKGTSQAKEKE